MRYHILTEGTHGSVKSYYYIQRYPSQTAVLTPHSLLPFTDRQRSRLAPAADLSQSHGKQSQAIIWATTKKLHEQEKQEVIAWTILISESLAIECSTDTEKTYSNCSFSLKDYSETLFMNHLLQMATVPQKSDGSRWLNHKMVTGTL